jgi:hypothetical protein
MAPNPWTTVQEEKAKELFHSRLNDEEFALQVGRTRVSYRSRIRYKKMSTYGRSQARHFAERTFARPTAEMLADAQKRLTLRSPICDILGDPPPGYSALDERLRHVKRPDDGDRMVGREEDPNRLNRISTATIERRGRKRTEEYSA